MGLEVYRMQTLNIDAARKLGQDQQNNDTLETPAPPAGDTGTPYSLNTPDILNSLISITTNPFFDNIPLTSTSATSTNTNTDSTAENAGGGPIESTTAAAPNNNGTGAANVNTGTTAYESEDLKVFATLEAASAPSTTTGTGPPPLINIMPPLRPTSVQSMTSQLIKDSLKHTIQSKRKSSGKEDLDIKAELSKAKIKKREELTPEDEERRRRRRERNKVAATKCRNKKKERTGLLAIESETLETSNVSLKSEISQLEQERQQLMDVLAAHNSVCTKIHRGGGSGIGPAAIASMSASHVGHSCAIRHHPHQHHLHQQQAQQPSQQQQQQSIHNSNNNSSADYYSSLNGHPHSNGSPTASSSAASSPSASASTHLHYNNVNQVHHVGHPHLIHHTQSHLNHHNHHHHAMAHHQSTTIQL